MNIITIFSRSHGQPTLHPPYQINVEFLLLFKFLGADFRALT